MVEFALVGVPLVFILVSTAEMARGMWNYQTLAFSVRAGARYASTHGKGCSGSCTVTVSNVAHSIAAAAVGLAPGNFNVVLTSATASPVSCTPLSNCYSNNTTWPPSADSAPGLDIRISGTYQFVSALSMLWPGDGTVPFGTFTLGAWTRQPIQF